MVEECFASQSHLGHHPFLLWTAQGGVGGGQQSRPPRLSGWCQPEISLRPDPTPMEILRGLA
ncbi:hypothetical protein ADK87_14535, partial [Streptomyces sp. NRRL F-4711]